MKWKVEYERTALVRNFERMEGWTHSDSNHDWNFFWASTATIQTMFHPEKGRRLNNGQVVNHFPKYYELTRKDLMVNNIKRYLRDQHRRVSKELAASSLSGIKSHEAKEINATIENFLPTSYTLPFDYNMFVEEFRKSQQNTIWIMKPCNGAQGRGIFLVSKLDQLKKWATNSKVTRYVVSRYINNPFLIEGRKFDLRIYGKFFF